jgi:hypothetical protein
MLSQEKSTRIGKVAFIVSIALIGYIFVDNLSDLVFSISRNEINRDVMIFSFIFKNIIGIALLFPQLEGSDRTSVFRNGIFGTGVLLIIDQQWNNWHLYGTLSRVIVSGLALISIGYISSRVHKKYE